MPLRAPLQCVLNRAVQPALGSMFILVLILDPAGPLPTCSGPSLSTSASYVSSALTAPLPVSARFLQQVTLQPSPTPDLLGLLMLTVEPAQP